MGKKSSVTELHPQSNVTGKTPNQKRLINSIIQYDIVIATGYAGCGKTFLTTSMASDWYEAEKHRKLVITRPMVSNGDDIGFLPGTETEKAIPWAHAPLDVLKSRLTPNRVECDLKNERIVVKPLQMLQGASYDDTWVLVDEAQNLTIPQAQMMVTRIGYGSKLLINGDIRQKNIKEESGLSYLISLFINKGIDVPIIDFEIDDCQRSELCKTMLKAIYE